MSDFGDPAAPPPPPPIPPAPAGPAGGGGAPFAAPAPPAPPAYGVPGYAPAGYVPAASMPAVKPPRPVVTVGAMLMVGGALLAVIGSFLNWFTIEGQSFTGFTSQGGETNDGPVFVFLAVVVGGLGISMLAARRMLAVAIIGVVFASFTVLAALADLSDVSDASDIAALFGAEFSTGPGLYVILIGGLVSLGGSIAALAKRRR